MKKTEIKKEKFFLIILILAFIDQVTKLFIILNKDKCPVTIIKDVLEIQYTENKGIAFGIGNGATLIISIVTAMIMMTILYVINQKYEKLNSLSRIGASLLISGGIGNLLDRIFRLHVVDFIYFKLIDFPIFNFADICIVIGVLIICFEIFLENRGENIEKNNCRK